MSFQMVFEPRGETELFFHRRFASPPERVFAAHVEPELLRGWLSVHVPLVDCAVDPRAGGRFRYVWRFADGREMAMGGQFIEVEAPHKTVHTEVFDEDWTDGPTTVTTHFLPDPAGCRLEMTVRYASPKGRASALATPMTDGMAMGYLALDKVLASAGAPTL